MDELTPEQEEAVAATVGAIQRIPMAITALPKEQRARRIIPSSDGTFEAAIKEFGIEGDMANAWLDMTMHGIQALVMEIEVGGGATGGTA